MRRQRASTTDATTRGPSPGPVARLTRWTIGPFGLKDMFTLFNLLSGVVAIRLALDGRPRQAGYAVIVGFLFGDLLDGFVARVTHTGNRFGGEFDTITDHFVHVVVPGVVLYTVYDKGNHDILGAVAFALLVAASSIRHALFAVRPFEFKLCWCGLPRTIAGFGALAFPLSHLFGRGDWAYLTGVVVVGLLCALQVVPVPYITHRGERALQLRLRVTRVIFVLSFPLAFAFAPDYFFDVLLLWVVGYAIGGPIQITSDERRRFREAYRRWTAEVTA